MPRVVTHRKSGVAVADGTFPVSIGPGQDGDDGDGGITPCVGARGPLHDANSAVTQAAIDVR